MTILNRLRAAFSAKGLADIVNATISPLGLRSHFRQYGRDPQVDVQKLVRNYLGWTYACASLNAAGVAQTPLRLYATRATGQSRAKAYAAPRPVDKARLEYIRRSATIGKMPQVATAEEIEEITVHPLLDLLRNINRHNNGYETMELTSILLDLTGKAFWHVQIGPGGVPTEIWFLRSQWMRIVPDAKQFISAYKYGVRQDKLYTFHPSEIIYFKCPNPTDPWEGMGPTQAAAWSMMRQDSMDRFEAATLSNMGRPDFVVKYTDGRLSDEDRVAIEARWNSRHSGPDRAGRVSVMDQQFDIEQIGWSPRELQFERGRPWTMKEIAAAFNVPVGFLDTAEIAKAPKSALSGSGYLHAKYGILPRLIRIEEKLNQDLVPLFGDGQKRLFLAFDNPVPEDAESAQSMQDADLDHGVITINEVRTTRGLPPVPWGDTPLIPMPIDQLGSMSDTSQYGSAKNAKAKYALLSDAFPAGIHDGGIICDSLKGVTVEVMPIKAGHGEQC
jgi:HK97 family phage portal protein